MPTRESSSSVSLNASRILNTVGTQPKQQWHGIYLASCFQNNDPLGEGRIKMFIPQVLGTAISNWARPLGLKPNDIPVPGEMVHAYFTGGDVNHPIWVRIDMTSQFNAIQNQINNIGPGSWSGLTLQNSWTNIGGYIPAQSRVLFPGVVQVVGHVQGSNINDATTIATLPAGMFSTSGNQVLNVNMISGGQGNNYIGTSTGSPTDVSGLNDGTISGQTDQAGLNNGTIGGTSGTGPNTNGHTHGPGSFSVNDGHHVHGNSVTGTLAVTDGHHQHTTSSVEVQTLIDQNSPMATVDTSGNIKIFNIVAGIVPVQLSFNGTLVAS